MPLMRSFFIALSRHRNFRRFAEQSRLGARVSSRFVAGRTLDDALRAAAELNAQGISVTLDSLGESVAQPEEAHRAAEVYHRLLDLIAQQGLNANISVKLTQMGLGIRIALAEEIALDLVRHAARLGSFVRIDMEDSTLTQLTLDIVRRIHAQPGLADAVGVVVQAYLHRSAFDIGLLAKEQIRVRLCKGAYQEPASLAFPSKADVDNNYILLSHLLLASSSYHGLATHDEAMIEAAKNYAAQQAIPPAHFEFQMLYGVRRDLQKQLVAEGYNVRVYVPFGAEWYPYFMRRLAERPANVFFIAKNFFRP